MRLGRLALIIVVMCLLMGVAPCRAASVLLVGNQSKPPKIYKKDDQAMGILVDIATVWLKGYISPAFFWLHIPGGGLFGIVFVIVSTRAFREMYGVRKNYASH